MPRPPWRTRRFGTVGRRSCASPLGASRSERAAVVASREMSFYGRHTLCPFGDSSTGSANKSIVKPTLSRASRAWSGLRWPPRSVRPRLVWSCLAWTLLDHPTQIAFTLERKLEVIRTADQWDSVSRPWLLRVVLGSKGGRLYVRVLASDFTTNRVVDILGCHAYASDVGEASKGRVIAVWTRASSSAAKCR